MQARLRKSGEIEVAVVERMEIVIRRPLCGLQSSWIKHAVGLDNAEPSLAPARVGLQRK